LCRTPAIMADAAYLILTGSSSDTGNFFIDDDVLAAHGVTDLDQYSVTPGTKNFLPDFFLD
jgi:citronellol/citronellal dehydrogenase